VVAEGRYYRRPMPPRLRSGQAEDRARLDVLARITDNPQLARAVPRLQPEVLHAVIAHYGLERCGELLALATPEQVSAVFDLDLWKADRAGAEDQFDAARFCEWLEFLVDAGPAIAAARLATMDVALVVAGLSPSITVFDASVFSSHGEPSGADPVVNAGLERGVHAEIGGYIVVARQTDAWQAIVDALMALAEHHGETFHRVMSACRTLSNAGWERDGLDDLRSDAEQARFDLSLDREQRRDRSGFVSPQQARAFLTAARRVTVSMEPAQEDAVFAAYRRSLDVASETDTRSGTESADAQTDDTASSETASAVASVIEVLRGAGVIADTPRALLSAGQDERSMVNAALNRHLQLCADADEAAWTARNQELAFLANALVAGCRVHGRSFTRSEAMDAVTATCNLGLEYWPQHWRASSTHTLVTIFQVGWSALYRDVSMVAADRVLDALDHVRTSDADLQFGLRVLRRELHKQREAGTPWGVCERLDVLATLDLPAWAALTALLDEYPVMLANVSALSSQRRGDRRPLTVNPSEFQCISNPQHVAAVHEFLGSLTELLTG